MRREWKQKGECNENELNSVINKIDYTYYLVFLTDKFIAGTEDLINRVEWDKVLELRLFSETQEFLARRTMTGENSVFQWRIASEDGLSKDEFIVKYQTLDIDDEKTEEGKFGNLYLMTTGGGRYELPIKKGTGSIKVISYISYDEKTGMANIYDNRLAGFIMGGVD